MREMFERIEDEINRDEIIITFNGVDDKQRLIDFIHREIELFNQRTYDNDWK